MKFRENWWYHICSDGQKMWKHKQYMSCTVCGFRNGKTNIIKGMRTL